MTDAKTERRRSALARAISDAPSPPPLARAVVVDWGEVFHTPRTGGQLVDLFGEIDDYFDAGVELNEDDCVVDVGANIGAFAIAAARRCRGRMTIHCFEPAPIAHAALVENARTNRWLRRTQSHVYALALGAPEDVDVPARLHYFARFPCDSTLDITQKRDEFRQFFTFQADLFRRAVTAHLGAGVGAIAGWLYVGWVAFLSTRLASWMADRYTRVQHITVAQDSLARFVRREGLRRIDLLKVDVEGYEVRVLRGLDADGWAVVRQVVVETDGRRAPMAELVFMLRRAGFERIRISRTRTAASRGLQNRIVVAQRLSGTFRPMRGGHAVLTAP